MAQKPDPRDRYLAIAARQFADHGFHGVSLSALARDAGVSKQALLHYFGTKERIYAEVLAALSNRLVQEVEAAPGDTPAARLIAYFDGCASGGLTDHGDVRLVVRALLDSDAAARTWPLKPYLDALTALARQTPRWQGAGEGAALAGIYQLIGAMQYGAISEPTLSGMYGQAVQQEIRTRLADNIRAGIRDFVGAD